MRGTGLNIACNRLVEGNSCEYHHRNNFSSSSSNHHHVNTSNKEEEDGGENEESEEKENYQSEMKTKKKKVESTHEMMKDIEDLVRWGTMTKNCPYFGSRSQLLAAEVIFMPYNYLVDPTLISDGTIQWKVGDQLKFIDIYHPNFIILNCLNM